MTLIFGPWCRSAMAALMMGDELHKFGRCRAERNDFSAMGLGAAINPGSRQIYLTFPADSTFKEEDVSNYFRQVTGFTFSCYFWYSGFKDCSFPLDFTASMDQYKM